MAGPESESHCMPSIAFATCRNMPEISHDDQLLAAELRRQGHHVEGIPWDHADVAWGHFDAVLLRSCWDYFEHVEKFAGWITGIQQVTLVLNAPDLVLPTLHKGYLVKAVSAGAAIPATVLMKRGEQPHAKDLSGRVGGHLAVVKPAVSASAHETHLVDLRTTEAHRTISRLVQSMDLLVQEFIPAINGGELSMVYVEGRFSHAVRKRPALGDWRVQTVYGGTVTVEATPREPLLAFGTRCLNACAHHEPTYARVDVIDAARGPMLMEVELIEPVLFLGTCAEAVKRLAEAVTRKIASSTDGVPA